jgi:hypothetical protein
LELERTTTRSSREEAIRILIAERIAQEGILRQVAGGSELDWGAS